MSNPVRTLIYDIETAPIISYNWGIWKQDAIRVKQDWYMLSAAWMWLGERTVQTVALPDFTLYDEEPTNDLGIAETLRDLFDEADIVVAHNGRRFDEPKAQARMLVHALDPPSAYREVDTLQVAKRHFKFTSNTLDALCKTLGIGTKVSTGGFGLWEDIIERQDPAAWRKMIRYNKHDVVLLEQLYLRLRPWMDQHPNLAMIGDKPRACPKCGSDQGPIQSRGWRYYQVTKRRAFRCHACGGIFYGRHLQKSDVEFVS